MTVRLELRRAPVNEFGRLIGQLHPRAKLTDAAVQQVLDLGLAEEVPMSPGSIARLVGCSRRTVRDILAGRRRVHQIAGYKLVYVRVEVADGG